MRVLVWVEHRNGAISSATLSAIAAAGQLGSVDLAIAGEDVGGVASKAAEISGVGTVRVCDDPDYAKPVAERSASLVVSLMPEYDAFFAAATGEGKAISPRVAALIDVMQISEIIAVEDGPVFRRPIYAGNIVETVRSRDAKLVVTVRGSAFDPVRAHGGAAKISTVDAPSLGKAARSVGVALTRSDRPELADATIVVSGGRALKDKITFEQIILPLADKLGAAVGASRAAVDAGYVSNDFQVGQTGKIVAPDLYIAIGISGAIQHLAGIKDAKTIVAINKDEDAPIFQMADIGLVGDLFEIIPELTRRL